MKKKREKKLKKSKKPQTSKTNPPEVVTGDSILSAVDEIMKKKAEDLKDLKEDNVPKDA